MLFLLLGTNKKLDCMHICSITVKFLCQLHDLNVPHVYNTCTYQIYSMVAWQLEHWSTCTSVYPRAFFQGPLYYWSHINKKQNKTTNKYLWKSSRQAFTIASLLESHLKCTCFPVHSSGICISHLNQWVDQLPRRRKCDVTFWADSTNVQWYCTSKQ